jgi:hypothetical protein
MAAETRCTRTTKTCSKLPIAQGWAGSISPTSCDFTNMTARAGFNNRKQGDCNAFTLTSVITMTLH